MRFIGITAFLAILTMLSAPAIAGDWLLMRVSTNCTLTTQEEGRMTMVMYDRDAQNPEGGRLTLGFHSPALNPQPANADSTVRDGPPILLEFDTGETLEDTPLIVGTDDPTMATFESEHIQRELDIIGKAKRVRVTTGGRTDEFDLSGLGESLPTLIKCVKSQQS